MYGRASVGAGPSQHAGLQDHVRNAYSLLSCQLSNHTFESEDELAKFLAGELTVHLLGGQDHLCLPGNPDQMSFLDGTSQSMPDWDCVGQ